MLIILQYYKHQSKINDSELIWYVMVAKRRQQSILNFHKDNIS